MQIEQRLHLGAAPEDSTGGHPMKAHSAEATGSTRVFGRDLTNRQKGASRSAEGTGKVSQSTTATDDAKESELEEVEKVKVVVVDDEDTADDDEMAALVAEPELMPWDTSDIDDDLSAAEYAKEIMATLREQEAGRTVGDFLAAQKDINHRMRAVLVDWMVAVHCKFQLTEPTYFLGLNLVDRFLATKVVKRTQLQLLGCSCLWIASKYHEIYAPEMDDFVYVSDGAFSSEQMVAMEVEVLNALSFELTVPTVLNYAERYSKISAHYLRKERERKIIGDLIMYCAEHSVITYALCQRAPSLVGAACFVYSSLSTKVFTVGTFRKDGLERVIGYSMDALLPTMRELDAVVKNAKRSKHKAVLNKYCNAEHSNIGKLNFQKLNVSFLAPPKGRSGGQK